MRKPKRCCYYCENLALVAGRDRLRGLCMRHGETMDAENGLCDDFKEQTICREYIKQLREKYDKMTYEERCADMDFGMPITGRILFPE